MLNIILLSVSLSLDALGVGMAYGLRKIRIPLKSKLLICLFSILYSGFALMVGHSLTYIIPDFLSNLLGITILICMGFWIIIQALLKKKPEDEKYIKAMEEPHELLRFMIKSLGITVQVIKNPMKGDLDRSGTIDARESILLGLALSVDAIGVGIGSALAGFTSLFIPLVIGLMQLLFLYAGCAFGEKFSLFGRLNKKLLSLLPGILLIFLALLRI